MATVYLVTGANSGLGLEFVRQLSQKNDVFIYATVRDISKATELNEIASKRKNVQVVAYQSEDDGSYLAGIIAKGHGKVDTIIANADVAEVLRPVADTPRSEFRRIFELSFVRIRIRIRIPTSCGALTDRLYRIVRWVRVRVKNWKNEVGRNWRTDGLGTLGYVGRSI